jgi:hypothetical protein
MKVKVFINNDKVVLSSLTLFDSYSSKFYYPFVQGISSCHNTGHPIVHFSHLVEFSFIFVLCEDNSSLPRNPVSLRPVVPNRDIRLDSSVVSCSFDVQMHYVVDVHPEVVIIINMLIEATKLCLLKLLSSFVANVTEVSLIKLFLLFGLSHLGKSINNDTEQNVKQYNLH